MAFKKAERKQAKLRLAIDGPSGSGKTYSALLLARGLVGPEGRIALIDTERGSAELYSHLTDFDTDNLTAPYSPDRYIVKMREAEAAGYDCIIVDGLSHAWSGTGGVLDMVDAATKASRGKSSFSDGWKEATPHHASLVEALLGLSCHLIVTIRTKTEWVVEKDDNGKNKPRKIGTKPEQRESLEYEFTTVLDLSMDGHLTTASKDRTGIFDDKHEVISEATGRKVREWLESGVDAQAEFAAELAAQREQCDLFCARIAELASIDSPAGVLKALDNWQAKHTPELSGLPKEMKLTIWKQMEAARKVAKRQLEPPAPESEAGARG